MRTGGIIRARTPGCAALSTPPMPSLPPSRPATLHYNELDVLGTVRACGDDGMLGSWLGRARHIRLCLYVCWPWGRWSISSHVPMPRAHLAALVLAFHTVAHINMHTRLDSTLLRDAVIPRQIHFALSSHLIDKLLVAIGRNGFNSLGLFVLEMRKLGGNGRTFCGGVVEFMFEVTGADKINLHVRNRKM